MKRKKPLTPQQRRFIAEYACAPDSCKAAQKAGYKPDKAKIKGKELLKDPYIMAEIHSEIEKKALTLDITPAFFVKSLLQIIKFSSEEELILDKTGSPTGFTRLRDPAITLRALDLLSKFYGKQQPETQATLETDNVRIMCIENLDESRI